MGGQDGRAGDPVWRLGLAEDHGDMNRGRMESESQTGRAAVDPRRVEGAFKAAEPKETTWHNHVCEPMFEEMRKD